ncbi:hypothetical protein [Seonamhaeicola sp. ML3]|uniref:hypothetical protein n=1 Tax=Seonamhaeicola sp. ML3 TaxID=2937786 RepID=UPI00200D28D1|nr:hypothetical protein [Seonamhaeicola sp. ML3]
MKRNKNFERAINNFSNGLLMLGSSEYENYKEFLVKYKDQLKDCGEEYFNFVVPEEAFNLFTQEVAAKLMDYKYATKAFYSLTTKHIHGEMGYLNTLTNVFLDDVFNGSIKINKKALDEFIKMNISEDKSLLTFNSRHICSIDLKQYEISF